MRPRKNKQKTTSGKPATRLNRYWATCRCREKARRRRLPLLSPAGARRLLAAGLALWLLALAADFSIHTSPRAQAAAMDALDHNDRYCKALAEWWQTHKQWHMAFPPSSLTDLVRPGRPPTLKHVRIGNPSPEQQLAYAEAFAEWKSAHALWEEQNVRRKQEVKKRGRPPDHGARAMAHRAKQPVLLERHAERERARYDATVPEPTELEIQEAMARPFLPEGWELMRVGDSLLPVPTFGGGGPANGRTFLSKKAIEAAKKRREDKHRQAEVKDAVNAMLATLEKRDALRDPATRRQRDEERLARSFFHGEGWDGVALATTAGAARARAAANTCTTL